MKQAGSAIEYVCIDVANGYTETFIEFVESPSDLSATDHHGR
jgi:hypothetical protein